MSLLPVCDTITDAHECYISNVGGSGPESDAVPCIKGSAQGVVRVANAAAGLVLVGDVTSAHNNRILGGQLNGGSLSIGNSTTSFQNIVLGDGTTTILTDLTLSGESVDINVGGNVNLTNGATGKSISGYYTQTVGPLNCPDTDDTPVPAPAGQTAGWYIIAASTAPGGQEQQQVSTLAYWNGTIYLLGGCNSNTAGSGRVAFNLNSAHTGIVYSNSTGAAQNGVSVAFTKLMN